ncbi:hypothetical protein [Xanthomonas sp. NCPPB 1062]|uniref:hypothetical protein n=1 Tax=Xanthomonas sp. NCPPB 1062 TaxID=487523 RepID=UPI0035587FCF
MIQVYKLDGKEPSRIGGAGGERLAIWQARIDGIQWLKKLVSENCAKLVVNGNGYPDIFSAQARWVAPILLQGPPGARDVWIVGEGDIVDGPISSRRSRFYREAILGCEPNDWLVIEVWDES